MFNLDRKSNAARSVSCYKSWWGTTAVWHSSHVPRTMKERGSLSSRSSSPGLQDPLTHSRNFISAHLRSLHAGSSVTLTHHEIKAPMPWIKTRWPSTSCPVFLLTLRKQEESSSASVCYTHRAREISYPAAWHISVWPNFAAWLDYTRGQWVTSLQGLDPVPLLSAATRAPCQSPAEDVWMEDYSAMSADDRD